MKNISQRTAKVSLILNVILIVFSISLVVFSIVQRVEADQRRDESEAQRQIAERQLERAIMNKLQADSAAMLAIEQAYMISVLEDSIANMIQTK